MDQSLHLLHLPGSICEMVSSRTAKTTEKGGVRGYDGGKKVSVRKRHPPVDTTGLVIRVAIHEANAVDRDEGGCGW